MALFDSCVEFERDTPVLRFNARKDPKAKWVLWPVLAWRVVAPVPKPQSLNLFQRTVLQLVRAGVNRLKDVGDRLQIAVDLAGLVMTELQGLGLVDQVGAITTRGLQQLEDLEEEPAQETHVGHVFSDPLTGKLWPRFLLDDLPVADVDLTEAGWPVLLSGSAGDPWKDRTFVVLPGRNDSVNLVRPSASEVLRAAQRHGRQREFDEVDDERNVPKMQKVSFIDSQPEPYLIALCLRHHESGDWMVEDPFGHGESPVLREAIEKRLDTQVQLRAWISPLVGGDTSEPRLAELQAEATWKVEEQLTLAIREHSAVHERLVAMQRALLEAELDDAPLDKYNDVLLKAQRVVERTLRALPAASTEGQPAFQRLARSDKNFNQELLDSLADSLGFDSPLPRRLSSVRRGKVQYAETNGGGSLRPLLLLALLCADRQDAHPLRRAAKMYPKLLHDLDELASARDSAAHDGPHIRISSVQAGINTAYSAVESLLLSD